jgi:purine-cytosine permease-like protein
MGSAKLAYQKGKMMAEQEPVLSSPPTQDAAAHVADYSRFTKMVKWGAILAAIAAALVLLIIT